MSVVRFNSVECAIARSVSKMGHLNCAPIDLKVHISCLSATEQDRLAVFLLAEMEKRQGMLQNGQACDRGDMYHSLSSGYQVCLSSSR